MSDQSQPPAPSFNPTRREVGRRRIPGTHKVEIVYANTDPNNPYSEYFTREILVEKEESSRQNE